MIEPTVIDDDKIVWTFKLDLKIKRKKSRGKLHVYYGYSITIPYQLAEIISHDLKTFYFYEHFNMICITPYEPNSIIDYQKGTLVPTSNSKTLFRLQLPNKLLDLSDVCVVQVVYDSSMLCDVSGEYGRVSISGNGLDMRKHLGRELVVCDDGVVYVDYVKYLNEHGVVDGVVLHDDLLGVLGTVYDGCGGDVCDLEYHVVKCGGEDYLHLCNQFVLDLLNDVEYDIICEESSIIDVLFDVGYVNNDADFVVFRLPLCFDDNVMGDIHIVL